MSDELRLTILGCGSSPGVPRVNGDWGACDPDEPKNRRRRCSALVERIGPDGTTVVVIDCGPDFRDQMLSADVRHIDGIVVTHAHADHIHGLDDIRSYVQGTHELMNVYTDTPTIARLMEGFGYCFETPPGSSYPPIARLVEVQPGHTFRIEGAGGPVVIEPLAQIHGSIRSLGLLIGSLAYCSDVSDFPPETVERLRGVRHLIIDALQHRPHPSHFSLGEALQWIDTLAVENAVLTHMHTPLDYRALRESLPDHVQPAYDGLTLRVRLA
ncbi:MBL fold metallo-hydrolase [Aureimonas populi]|uniref:MBL fold metallo-hydrolase n=1 Tax=Aureimonas populi TaxID=1701758 RepID=A0ABW5CLX3_9HYPH|nr:MBL fold metallo-hydrolase [Aureimonas populi]